MTYQKDIITLLDSFLQLLKVRKARLLLVGSGTEEGKIRFYIKKNRIQKFIKIVDFQSNPYPFILKSDIKILSSRFEGNPNILLEVACLKKLIISSDCKVGPSEILQRGKGGILFKVGDSKSLYKILKNLDLKYKIIQKKINHTYNYVKKILKKI